MPLILKLEFCPESRGEKVEFVFPCFRPRNLGLQRFRVWLFDAEPAIFQGLLFIADEREPARLFPSGDSIRLGQYTY